MRQYTEMMFLTILDFSSLIKRDHWKKQGFYPFKLGYMDLLRLFLMTLKSENFFFVEKAFSSESKIFVLVYTIKIII